MKHARYLVVILTLTIALSGPALGQSGYTYQSYPHVMPAMPGNGQPQGRSPQWTPQQPYHLPVPVPHHGQDQSHFSLDPGSPQFGPLVGGYDAPVGCSEPDHTELETCLSTAARRLKEAATVVKLMAACSIEVDQWMGQCVQGGIPSSSCASLWGSFATDAEKAAHGGADRRN